MAVQGIAARNSARRCFFLPAPVCGGAIDFSRIYPVPVPIFDRSCAHWNFSCLANTNAPPRPCGRLAGHLSNFGREKI
jgi:hypothetical protein